MAALKKVGIIQSQLLQDSFFDGVCCLFLSGALPRKREEKEEMRVSPFSQRCTATATANRLK